MLIVYRHAYVEFMSIEATKEVWEEAKLDIAKDDSESRFVLNGTRISVCLYNRNVQMDVAKGACPNQHPPPSVLFIDVHVLLLRFRSDH